MFATLDWKSEIDFPFLDFISFRLLSHYSVVEYFPIFLLFLFQLDGGITTPPNELEDISEFGMLFSQVDGGNDDSEKIPDSKDSKEANPATSTEDTSTVV